MNHLDDIKQHLDLFFKEASNQTISRIIKKEKVFFNKSLFEIEKHLYDLKQAYQVNQNLNAGINSNSILNSFNYYPRPFRSNDYSLSFLLFLSMQRTHNAEDLLEMMSQFIEIIKGRLSYEDIVTTETGVTRCYTNLRFTLKELRDFGLVYSTTKINNVITRSILPTPFSYLIALFLGVPSKSNIISYLPEPGKESKYLVTPLYDALQKIKKDPDDFLNKLLIAYPEINDLEEVISEMSREYYGSVLQFITLTSKGYLIDKKALEDSIKKYYLTISDQVKISLKLREIIPNITSRLLF
jgi:hypothetical protein